MMATRVVAVMVAVMALTGCGRLLKASCAQPGDYAGAVQNPPLKVPAGLTAPDTRSALPIPDIEASERTRQATEGCLDAPPKFTVPRESAPAA